MRWTNEEGFVYAEIKEPAVSNGPFNYYVKVSKSEFLTGFAESQDVAINRVTTVLELFSLNNQENRSIAA